MDNIDSPGLGNLRKSWNFVPLATYFGLIKFIGYKNDSKSIYISKKQNTTNRLSVFHIN